MPRPTSCSFLREAPISSGGFDPSLFMMAAQNFSLNPLESSTTSSTFVSISAQSIPLFWKEIQAVVSFISSSLDQFPFFSKVQCDLIAIEMTGTWTISDWN